MILEWYQLLTSLNPVPLKKKEEENKLEAEGRKINFSQLEIYVCKYLEVIFQFLF